WPTQRSGMSWSSVIRKPFPGCINSGAVSRSKAVFFLGHVRRVLALCAGSGGCTRGRVILSAAAQIKQQKRSIVGEHSTADDLTAFAQVASTLIPLGALWWAAAWSVGESY